MTFTKSFQHSEALLKAAIEEFCAQGYEQASINVILNKAGMSKGQFYYHFGNKEGLYLALIDVLIQRKMEFMASLEPPADFPQDIFGMFSLNVKQGLAFGREYPLINRFSESFLRERGTPIYEKAMTIHSFESNEGLNEMIAQAYDNGDFRADLPLSFVQKTVSYLFDHVADLTDLTSVENAEENLNYLIEFMKTGLASKNG